MPFKAVNFNAKEKEKLKIKLDIPRREVAGMRDKLIREYFSVNLELVWET
ncbi:MAG: HepT-like ribonuclease domain-containing protein [Candidatus Bathyarchaeia archaeon]